MFYGMSAHELKPAYELDGKSGAGVKSGVQGALSSKDNRFDTGGRVLYCACSMKRQFPEHIDSLAAAGAVLANVWLEDVTMPVVAVVSKG